MAQSSIQKRIISQNPPLGSIPPHGKNFPVMEQNLMDRAKKNWVEGSNPPHSKNFSLSGAKFHGFTSNCFLKLEKKIKISSKILKSVK